MRTYCLVALGFVGGCFISTVLILNVKFTVHSKQHYHHRPNNKDDANHPSNIRKNDFIMSKTKTATTSSNMHNLTHSEEEVLQAWRRQVQVKETTNTGSEGSNANMLSNNAVGVIPSGENNPPVPVSMALRNQRIIVAIAAFDFSQVPHLEEVLDSYHDICWAGVQKLDVYIHATVAYPVTLIDLWNTRYSCENFSITVVLKSSTLRLHLVDCHRTLFYDKINEYDLFIYTEDDIRVTPTTVATYLQETNRIAKIVDYYNKQQNNANANYKASDFNVGIVRYEYNYPSNVIIDDKTRHATQNVTRVYWEHSSKSPPIIGNVAEKLPQSILSIPIPTVEQVGGSTISKLSSTHYIEMKNHHQGMFLATQQLLKDWQVRPKCEFSKIRNRPGKGHQPTEGTQRVWMSSQMLYGGRHCNVQQVFPTNSFGSLSVWHLPNKNYRRVGKYRTRKFSDGTEKFEVPPKLLTALELHLELRKAYPDAKTPQLPYKGPIYMIDEVDRRRTKLLDRRMEDYKAYIQRGGILSESDFLHIDLVEEE